MELRITSGADAGKTVQVQGNEFTIGRDAACDLTLADGKASRRHAALRVLPDGRATLYDLGSSNGTFVNGQRVQSVLLAGGEQLQIGDTVMLAAPAAPAAAPQPTGVTAAVPPQPQAPVPPPTQPLQPAALQPPSPAPVARPRRTQSAIQRVMLQRAVNRATIIGIIAIVLVIGVGVAAALGVFSKESKGTVSNAEIVDKAR